MSFLGFTSLMRSRKAHSVCKPVLTVLVALLVSYEIVYGLAREITVADKAVKRGTTLSVNVSDNAATPAVQLKQGSETRNASKVLFVTYMRSGSSFLGAMLEENLDVQYWFEPLDGAYMHEYGVKRGLAPLDITTHISGQPRILPEFEHALMKETLLSLLNCNISALPPEVLLHKFIWRTRPKLYVSCAHEELRKARVKMAKYKMEKKGVIEIDQDYNCPFEDSENRLKDCRDWLASPEEALTADLLERRHNYLFMRDTLQKVTNTCSHMLQNQCAKSPTHAVKTIRLSMDTVAQILSTDPTIKIIHLLRDPRGILHSRYKIELMAEVTKKHTSIERTKDSATRKSRMHELLIYEGRLLCLRMSLDLETAAVLRKNYPGQILEMVYESIAAEPLKQYAELYDFLGLKQSRQVEEFIYKATHAEGKQDVWSVSRSNSTKTAHRWEDLLSSDTKLELSDICKDVLQHMGLANN